MIINQKSNYCPLSFRQLIFYVAFLGAHPDKDGTTFRTFAPAASRITVIGEFNDWQEWELNKTYDGNFWECYARGAKPGMMYKYRIYRQDGSCVEHCDPYGFGMELRPAFASIIRDLSHYKFKDSKWMQKRSVCKDKPLNIYELHFGSFKKPSKKADDWYTYVEMIDILIPYLKENDYNYIEIMPLSEHPCDESWGYQNTGFFSPTARYGTAEELMKFIDACHKNDIGVIMDFVPVHFVRDDFSLSYFDGTPLYEYEKAVDADSQWGTANFNLWREEVRSFLMSAASFWIDKYHVDGLRMDAISNVIHWHGNKDLGENEGALHFIKRMNYNLVIFREGFFSLQRKEMYRFVVTWILYSSPGHRVLGEMMSGRVINGLRSYYRKRERMPCLLLK